MTNPTIETNQIGAISASWDRCSSKYKLLKGARNPILRLQSTEIAPRLEKTSELTGGRIGIFRQLAQIALSAGHCLVVTDADGILVRIEFNEAERSRDGWNGIGLGTCWDERVAGTNGVAMAISEGTAFTVRGKEHFYSALQGFSCTAAPILDAENQLVGVIDISTIDKGNIVDYLFANQLVSLATDRIQRVLFKKHFCDVAIISISNTERKNLFGSNELVAVSETGEILGTTRKIHNLVGKKHHSDLKGLKFEDIFGANAEILFNNPDHALVVKSGNGDLLELSVQLERKKPFIGRNPKSGGKLFANKKLRQHLASPLKNLAGGQKELETLYASSLNYFNCAMPFVIEGESGTGKSTLIVSIHKVTGINLDRIVIVDCASLVEGKEDCKFFQKFFSRTLNFSTLPTDENESYTLVLDNIDKIQESAQNKIRKLLENMEIQRHSCEGTNHFHSLRTIATCRKPLLKVLENDGIGKDLYFQLANTVIKLPPLRQFKQIGKFVRSLANQIAGTEVYFTEEAKIAISNHDWFGNMRELRSVLNQALIGGDGKRISLVDLQSTSIFLNPVSTNSITNRTSAQPRICYDERTMLIDALISSRWNVSQAARILNIGRATIYRKMSMFDICRPNEAD